MQRADLSLEQSILQNQLTALTEAFDIAIKKDLTLAEVKKIFHEMRIIQSKLDEIREQHLKSGQNQDNQG